MASKPIKSLPPLLLTYALQKDNPYKEIITEKYLYSIIEIIQENSTSDMISTWFANQYRLIRINNVGLESHLHPKPDAKYDDCKYPDDITAKLTVIRLKDVSGALTILVIGLVLASMAFLFEKMVSFMQKKKKKPPPLGDNVP